MLALLVLVGVAIAAFTTAQPPATDRTNEIEKSTTVEPEPRR